MSASENTLTTSASGIENGSYDFVISMGEDHFRQHVEAVFHQTNPIERFGLFSALRSALQSTEVELGCLSSQLGLSSTSPENLLPSDFALLLGYVREKFEKLFREYISGQSGFMNAVAAEANRGDTLKGGHRTAETSTDS